MNILFAGIISGTSIIWDKEFGFLKEILVAPVSRTSIALGKTLGGSLNATVQGMIVLLLFPFIGFKIGLLQAVLSVLSMVFIGFCITSLGILIAVRMKSFEGFGIMNNFVVMPLFFLSGAMYPIDKVPYWIKTFILINPVNYSVDLVRHFLLDIPSKHGVIMDLTFLLGFVICTLCFVIFLFNSDNI